jgi:hypothetical protein
MNTRRQPGTRQPSDVAETVARAIGGRRIIVVDGAANWVQTVLLGRVLHPRHAAVLAARIMRGRVAGRA